MKPVIHHIGKNFRISGILLIGFAFGQLAMVYAKPEITCMVQTSSAMPNIKEVKW